MAARPTLYLGEAQLMTNMGPLPISFDIEAASLADAIAKYGEAAKTGVEQALRELQEMRRQASSSLVIPPAGAASALTGGGGLGGLGGGGGRSSCLNVERKRAEAARSHRGACHSREGGNPEALRSPGNRRKTLGPRLRGDDDAGLCKPARRLRSSFAAGPRQRAVHAFRRRNTSCNAFVNDGRIVRRVLAATCEEGTRLCGIR